MGDVMIDVEESYRYDDEEVCEGAESCSGVWFAGAVGHCDKECGGGSRSREVFCIKDGAPVEPAMCQDAEMPFLEEECNVHSCQVEAAANATDADAADKEDKPQGR